MDIIKTDYGYILHEKIIRNIASRAISIMALLFIMAGIIFVDFNELNFIVKIIFRTIACIVILFKIYEIIFLHIGIKIFKEKVVFLYIQNH
jgi:hypothetical protein